MENFNHLWNDPNCSLIVKRKAFTLQKMNKKMKKNYALIVGLNVEAIAEIIRKIHSPTDRANTWAAFSSMLEYHPDFSARQFAKSCGMNKRPEDDIIGY